MEGKYLHKPVFLKEVIYFLNLTPGKVIIDATIGGAGHSEEILRRISPGGLLIGIDRDSESLSIAHERLKALEGAFKLINRDFRNLKEIARDLGIGEVDGILFDLGISSIQMETRERGFSIKNDGPLDMRMDRTERLTAKDLVNTLSEAELSSLIKNLGEERFHRRIAKGIVEFRKKTEIQTTAQLADVISGSIPARRMRERIHPATRTFQAIRIKLNGELAAIEESLNASPEVLKEGGRLCVISFHSLEDRIVKDALRRFQSADIFHVLTKKPIRASENEIFRNPRARSAKLRAAIKV